MMHVLVRVLKTSGFLFALLYAAWLNFVDFRDFLAGGGSLPALIISVLAGILGTAFAVHSAFDRTAADEPGQRPKWKPTQASDNLFVTGAASRNIRKQQQEDLEALTREMRLNAVKPNGDPYHRFPLAPATMRRSRHRGDLPCYGTVGLGTIILDQKHSAAARRVVAAVVFLTALTQRHAQRPPSQRWLSGRAPQLMAMDALSAVHWEKISGGTRGEGM
jgi:hypothetical protein